MRHLRILIVDDDQDFLRKAESVLSAARYSVTIAADFGKATQILRHAKGKSVVISELSVAGKSGLDFLKEALQQYPNIPFTFLSSSPPLEGVIEALKQGAYDFLRKPVDPDILRRSVARSVEKLNLSIEIEKQDQEIRELLARSHAELKESRNTSGFKGFLISMAAHDFRSMLTVLDGCHHKVKEMCASCDKMESTHFLEQTGRAISHLRAMANTLWDYEAAERGELAIDAKEFALDKLLAECLAFYKPYAEQKGVRMTLASHLHTLRAKGDPARVTQILGNLLYNAVKFTPAKGEISVGAKNEDGKTVTVWVQDTGVGIPKALINKILEKSDIVAKKDTNSRVGLGLNICRRLIEAQNGKIWIESDKGTGTRVSFSLPGK